MGYTGIIIPKAVFYLLKGTIPSNLLMPNATSLVWRNVAPARALRGTVQASSLRSLETLNPKRSFKRRTLKPEPPT